MAIRSSCLVFYCGLLLVQFTGCADAKQDKGEIPATIDQVKDAARDKEAPKATDVDSTAQQEPDPASGLEAATGDQDLATIMRKEKEEFEKQTIEIPATWKRMSKESHLWADPKTKQVIARGSICVQDGLLEMFACPRDTKEHEAVISVHAKAAEIHATLLALKVDPGQPTVFWREQYYPVDGPIMNIEVWWTDEDGKLVKRRAQDMIRNTETREAMACDFVFGGSGHVYDTYHKREMYFADDGPMINVANQPDAMIDVSIESSEAAYGSLFEAFTENVPSANTKVYILISASGKSVDKADGKPTIEQLEKEAEVRRAELQKRLDELDKKIEARKAKEAKEAEEDK